MSMQDAATDIGGQGPKTFVIRISKGRSGQLNCDPDKLFEWVYARCVIEGAQLLANKGMATIKKGDFDSVEEFQEAVMNKARENLQAMYDGTLKLRGVTQAKDKHPLEVKVIARRMAKAAVKAKLKEKGYKITQVPTKVITEMANTALAAQPEFYDRAYVEFNATKGITLADVAGLDFSNVPLDQKKVARQAEAKAAKTLSAAKANQVANRGAPPRR